jgi:spermidine synthase
VSARGRIHESVSFSELDGVRYLHLGESPWVQSAIRLDAPHVLELEYVQQMTSWLLFLHAPAQIALLGLGGGSLARWNLRHLRQSRLVAVEHNPAVILAAKSMFGLPAEGPRFEIVAQDALKWVQAARPATYGVVQVDLYDSEADGPVLDSIDFYRAIRRLLPDSGGLVAVNLFGRPQALKKSLTHLKFAFDDRVRLMAPSRAGNRVALCFHGPSFKADPGLLGKRAVWLETKFGFPYSRWLEGADD